MLQKTAFMSNALLDLEDIDIFILCGGKGERLRSAVSDRSKVLADINGKPFLEILIENLVSSGFKRIILGVGFLKEQIISHFNEYLLKNYDSDLEIIFSEEDKPLGTGGALKKAEPFIKSNYFFVMNGDVFVKIPFKEFYRSHLERKSLISILISKMPNVRDCGTVELDDNSRILSFKEKDSVAGERLVSAGVYIMSKDIFNHLPFKDSFSLEYDLFPNILDRHCHGFITEEEFIDIGTPERYKKILQLFANGKI